MNITLIRIGLFVLACSSPLLTLTWLWQIKEWRIDRLQEHLRSHGYVKQLIGILRPAVVIIILIALQTTHLPAYAKIDMSIAALSAVSLLQIVSRKQRYPTWTSKAIATVALAMCLNVLLIATLKNSNWLLVAIPLLQSGILAVAWSALLPLDHAMKERIMNKAQRLVEHYENLTVVGITGSVGKTTTKELLAHIMQDSNMLFTPAYVNSEMGVAQWLLRELPKQATDATLIAIVEMGAYKTGEIARLCQMTKPRIGIITYIGTQHIALFGSQEKLCNAKAEIIKDLPPDGTAIINADNENCKNVTDQTQANVLRVGTGGHADLEAFDIEETQHGISFRLADTKVTVPLHGTHNVTNVLLAIAAATKLGISVNEAAQKLRTFTPPSKTFAIRNQEGVTILDDTHNASAESFRAAIAWAKAQPMAHKVLLTPGLIELGEQEQRIHRELGEQANGIFDRVIFTSKNHRAMFQEGHEQAVELADRSTQKVSNGDLLVCVGKIAPSTIEKLLP